MSLSTDVRVVAARLFLIPVTTRVPLKFGAEVIRHVTCSRVWVRVQDRAGRQAEGWGETPLSVQWAWPSPVAYEARLEAMLGLSRSLVRAWADSGEYGHPLELGWDFLEQRLDSFACPAAGEAMPRLARLICASPFDVALHDAYGVLLGRPVYELYGPQFLSRDLASFLEPAADVAFDFRGRYPAEFLRPREDLLHAWHLVGGLDPIEADDLRGDEPEDGYPVLLGDWIRRDGLTCLKIKLRGNDAGWDLRRIIAVGELGEGNGVEWLTADFNCTVREPDYVNAVLDRLRAERPRLYQRLLYVEQPFAYELEAERLDVRSVSARKPLFLDESAHDWRVVRLGRELGWTGVALKTCKTQSGALLSLCWARAHGMALMVQDLTNPMLAQLPHLLLAAHAGTICGVETNSMQFYPAVSEPEARVHPGCFRRRGGLVDLSTLRGPGFGYRAHEIQRELPAPAASAGSGV